MRSYIPIALAVAILLGLTSSAAMAVPYASAITDLGGGDYSFVLNEDADYVIIKRIGDTPLALGPLSAGTHTFNIGAGTGFEIWVGNNADTAWSQISDNDWNAVKFYSPVGVDVNRDATSPYFGWIYVTEALGGTTGGRTTTDGVFALLADCTDAIAQGDTGITGGEDWTLSSASPWKLHIGADNYVYVCDWSDAHSGLWRFSSDLSGTAEAVLDPDGIDGSGLNGTHGSISDFAVCPGEGDQIMVYSLDEDMGINAGTGGFIGKYDIDTTALPYVGAPTEVTDLGNEVVNGTLGVDIDSNGRFYWTQYRWNADFPSFMIFDDTGDPNAPDIIYSQTIANAAYRGGVQVDEANERIIIGGYTGDFEIRDLNDPESVLAMPGASGYTRAVSYDIVGNVYAVNSSTERLTVWSSGGNWITVTGSDGTFTRLCPGDLDGDYDVDLSDLAELLSSYGETSGMTYENGDFDGDGDVDLSDLAALLAFYGDTCP